MAHLHGFDANAVEPSDSFDPVPAGEYLCVITASDEKPTKSGNGTFLELEFEVIDGPHKGRKLWDRLNLNNPSEMAVKIARATLSAICRAVGVMQPRDSCELHDLPLVCKVRVEKRADTDELTNVIKGYRARRIAGTAAPAPQAAASGSTPPWKRPAQPVAAAAAAHDDVPF